MTAVIFAAGTRRFIARVSLGALALLLPSAGWLIAAAEEGPVWRRNMSIGAGQFISSHVTALGAQKDRVWVGTEKGLVCSSDNGRSWQQADLASAVALRDGSSEPVSSSEAMLCNYVTSIYVAGGNVWVGTLGGLFASSGGQGGQWYLFGEGRGLAPGGVWTVAGQGNRLWLVGQGGVFRSDTLGSDWQRVTVPGEFRTAPAGSSSSGRAFTCAAVSENAAWLGAPQLQQVANKGFSLLRFGFNSEKWERVWFGGELQASAVPLTLNCIRAFGKEVWVGTSIGAFFSEDEGAGGWRHFSSTQKLASDLVLDILRVDKRIWVATGNGLCYSQNGGKSWVCDEYPRGNMTCLTVDRIALWVGTEGGVLRRLAGGRYWESHASTTQIHGIAVQKVEDAARWWVATGGGVCVSVDKGLTWRAFTVADGLPSNVVNDIVVDDDGQTIWVATDGGVASRSLDDDYWRRYGFENGLLSSHVSSIAASGGTIWAATGRGLSRLDKDGRQFRTFRQTQGWQHVAFDGKTLFAASMEWKPADLQQALNDSLEPLTTPLFRFVKLGTDGGWQNVAIDGYRGGTVYDVAIYGGTIWVASETGLFCQKRDGSESWARYASDSLWGPAVTCLARFPDGGLMAQAALRNPPGPYGVWSVTASEGKEWFTLKPRLPAIVTAAAKDGDVVIAGGATGLFVLDKAVSDTLAPGRPGWMAFNAMAFLATSSRGGLPQAVAQIDPDGFHNPTLWVGTRGHGIIERYFPLGDIVYGAPTETSGGAGPLSDDILCIAPEPQAVWFGADRGVSAFNRVETWRSLSPVAATDPGLHGILVRGAARLGSEMWFGTEAGCSVFNLETVGWRFFSSSNSPLPATGVKCLEVQGGILWAGTDSGLFRFTPPNKWTIVVKGADVLCLAAGRHLLCAGTDRGFYAIDKEGNVVERLDHENSLLPANRIDRIVLDGLDVWASTEGVFVRLNLVTDVGAETYEAAPSVRGPAGVLVVINQNSPGSIRVGEYYAEARRIPPENLCYIQCPTEETVSREVFERDIRSPIAHHLLRNGLSRRISYVVTTFGVPLRIGPAQPTPDMDAAGRTDRASVDSELCLLAEAHPLQGPISNPYLHRAEPFNSTKFGMYLVTRLDGPTPESAIHMIDSALRAEKDKSLGTAGSAYLEFGPFTDEEYPRQVDVLRSNQQRLAPARNVGRSVVVSREPMEGQKETLNAFLYMGWPTAEKPRQRFSWSDGAVAVVMEPLSCASLRDAAEQAPGWCAGAVQEGLSAGIGSCYNGTPSSWTGMADFFKYLDGGYYWAEVSYMSLRYLSWQQVVLGDPLYKPFL